MIQRKQFFKTVLKTATIGGMIGSALVLTAFKTPTKEIIKPLSATLKAPVVPTFKNWGIMNTTAQSHVNAPEAWKITEGSSSVVVAVIDTGVDATHKDLAINMWQDPEKKGEKVYGWNFVNDKANPSDDHGHGTHVAGIIGAVADPAAGVSGVAHKVSIMAVKYYSEANTGPVNLRNTIRALNYAIDHGAKIINYSGGGPERSEEEYIAMKRAESKGILVVAAAGNERSDTDKSENYYYPAAYRLSNTISVAAIDINNKLLPSSNWGKTHVDVAAPGDHIYSTLPGGRYGYMSGTSQATAFVTGMAALLLSQNPKLTPQEIKKHIMASVDKLPELQSKLASGGKVNAFSALVAARGDLKPTTALADAQKKQDTAPVALVKATQPSVLPAAPAIGVPQAPVMPATMPITTVTKPSSAVVVQ